jgi:two-component system sensor histidine kinase QseC
LHWETAQLAGTDADRARAYAQIGVGIERLSHLVSQLLALAAIESRGASVFTTAVDWHRVVENVLSDVLPVIESSGCEVSVVWPEDGAPPLPLTGDETLLATLLRNLIDNSVRYSPPRTQVQVRFTAQALTIEDEGPGLAAEQLTRLGDRFYRPAGQAQSGSGLGISIVRRVASLHGLDVQFASRDGGGLCVTVARRAVDERPVGR